MDLLKENAAAIIAGISVGTLVSLGSALALALALDLTREQYATPAAQIRDHRHQHGCGR